MHRVIYHTFQDLECSSFYCASMGWLHSRKIRPPQRKILMRPHKRPPQISRRHKKLNVFKLTELLQGPFALKRIHLKRMHMNASPRNLRQKRHHQPPCFDLFQKYVNGSSAMPKAPARKKRSLINFSPRTLQFPMPLHRQTHASHTRSRQLRPEPFIRRIINVVFRPHEILLLWNLATQPRSDRRFTD